MLRSALATVRSAALHSEYYKQLNPVHLSRLIGTNFRCYTAQSTSPDTNASKDEASAEQTVEPEKKAEDSAKETKENEHDRLLREKEALLKDLQVG